MAGSTTGTRKRAPAVKPTPRSVIATAKASDIEPLYLSSDDDVPEPNRVTIAYLDKYPLTMPEEIPPNIALKVLRTQRVRGAEVAMMEMLEGVLGEEGFDRLSNWKKLTTPNLIAIFRIVQEVAMGALEIPKSGS